MLCFSWKEFHVYNKPFLTNKETKRETNLIKSKYDSEECDNLKNDRKSLPIEKTWRPATFSAVSAALYNRHQALKCCRQVYIF